MSFSFRNNISLVGLFILAIGCKVPGGGNEQLPPPITPVANPQVWFAPNAGTPDTLDLVSAPDQWAQARSKIHVFQMYVANVGHDYWGHLPGCINCGPVVYPNLVAADFFRKMDSFGIKLAFETGAVKPGNNETCSGYAYADGNREIFRRLREAGGRPTYMIMDEPLMGGKVCGVGFNESVNGTVRFIQRTREHFRAIYPDGEDLQIGLVEPYPYFSAGEIVQFLTVLRDVGYKMPFFHLDIDLNGVANHNISEAQFAKDLHQIYDFCKNNGIPYGHIYTGFDDKTEQSFYNRVIAWVERSKKVLGVPEHLKFQSWALNGTNPDGTEIKSLPYNLPETHPTRHTRLVVDGLSRLGL